MNEWITRKHQTYWHHIRGHSISMPSKPKPRMAARVLQLARPQIFTIAELLTGHCLLKHLKLYKHWQVIVYDVYGRLFFSLLSKPTNHILSEAWLTYRGLDFSRSLALVFVYSGLFSTLTSFALLLDLVDNGFRKFLVAITDAIFIQEILLRYCTIRPVDVVK